jgi:F-type H+-transporting ATPase subunit alpha
MSAGTVISIRETLARIAGMPDCMFGEQFVLADGVAAWALRLEEDAVVAAILDRQRSVQPGSTAEGTGHLLQTPCGPSLLGRVVDPLGRAIDGGAPVDLSPVRRLDPPAPGLVEIAPGTEPLSTGVKILDALYPMGRGQSRAILGPCRTGKTMLALDVLLHQDSDTICVYGAIGQRREQLGTILNTLRIAGALARTIVVATTPDYPPALRMLTPLAACSQAEWWAREDRRNVLLILDDLNAVVAGCQALTAMLGPLSPRHIHSAETLGFLPRLLDRPNRLSAGGSVSALSIIEVAAGKAVDFLPEPLATYFSGLVVLDEKLFRDGFRPAVRLDRSGASAHCPLRALRDLEKNLFCSLAAREQLAAFAATGAELDARSVRMMERGERVRTVLKQPAGLPLTPRDTFLILFAVLRGHTDAFPPGRLAEYERELLDWLPPRYPALMAAILGRFSPHGEGGRELDAAVADFNRHFT